MDTVHVGDPANRVQPAAVMRSRTEALGLTDVASNYYEPEPDGSFAFAYHNHGIQEEVFHVRSATGASCATVRTATGRPTPVSSARRRTGPTSSATAGSMGPKPIGCTGARWTATVRNPHPHRGTVRPGVTA